MRSLCRVGISAIGISGILAGLLFAQKRPPEAPHTASSIKPLVAPTADTPSSPLQETTHSQIVVESEAQVSLSRAHLPHNEVIIAADPRHPSRLLVGSKINYTPCDNTQSLAYRSWDGGKTWKVAFENRNEKNASDPAVAYGPDGIAYFSTTGARNNFVSRSQDGGQTWQGPTNVDAKANLDRQYLAVDCTNGKYRGRVYWNSKIDLQALGGTGDFSTGQRQTGIALYFSTDEGK